MTPTQERPDRQFTAFARPQGHAGRGIFGAAVEIHERLEKPGRGVRKLQSVRVLSHAEAAQLHYELGEALRAFDLAKSLARDVAGLASSSAAVGQQERARPYTGPYPIRDHGTLADHGFLNAEEPR